jgi:Zn-dependent protease
MTSSSHQLEESETKLLEATVGVGRYHVLTRRPVTVALGPRGYLPALVGGLVGLAVSRADGAAAAILAAVVTGVALEVALAVHEAGHLVISRVVEGVRPRMLLLRSSGGVSIVEGNLKDARGAALFAAGGPLASVALTLVYAVVGVLLPLGPIRDGLLVAATLNLFVLVVNLLPVAPNDGYALFRSAVWAQVGSRAEAEKRALAWSRAVLAVGLAVSLLTFTFGRTAGIAAFALLAALTVQHHLVAVRLSRAAGGTQDALVFPRRQSSKEVRLELIPPDSETAVDAIPA